MSPKLYLLLVPFSIILTACSFNLSTQAKGEKLEPQASQYPVLGTASELKSETWLNTDSPLRLSDLRGQVVLLDMWTFG